jgi:DNA polymerase III delta subunit
LEQIGPDWKRMQAKAVETDAAQAGEKQARKALEQLQSQLKPVIDVLRPLNDQERQTLLVVAEHAKEKLLGQRMEKLREQQRELEALRQQQHKAGQDRGWSR